VEHAVDVCAADSARDTCALDPEVSARTEPPAISPSAALAMMAVRRVRRLLNCMDPPGGEAEAIWCLACAGKPVMWSPCIPESRAVRTYCKEAFQLSFS